MFSNGVVLDIVGNVGRKERGRWDEIPPCLRQLFPLYPMLRTYGVVTGGRSFNKGNAEPYLVKSKSTIMIAVIVIVIAIVVDVVAIVVMVSVKPRLIRRRVS